MKTTLTITLFTFTALAQASAQNQPTLADNELPQLLADTETGNEEFRFLSIVQAGSVAVGKEPVGPNQVALPSVPVYHPARRTALAAFGATYIPVDSPIYPAALRLYSLGFLDTAFISMRPWTRQSLLHAVQESTDAVNKSGNDEAVSLLLYLSNYFTGENTETRKDRGIVSGVDTVYLRLDGVHGSPLRDSYHIGQTQYNDYGRPYAAGFNPILGTSLIGERGRFSLYLRYEYEHSPSGPGYSPSLANYLSNIDGISYTGFNLTQATIPAGPLPTLNLARIVEGSLSVNLLGHEISGGKTDAWLGPGMGGAMAWSNNAEDIYSFRVNRVEPLHIPLLSHVLGPLRYDFFVGSLKGHTTPNSPWIHSEMFSFRPLPSFEFSFQRSVIWGGQGHEPITLHTFLRSFFDTSNTTAQEKLSRNDPGARFSDFSFSWRLPYLRQGVLLYVDSITHDDVSPVSAPRRASYRPGIYLASIPYLKKADLRVEATTTDPPVSVSMFGRDNYFETIQRQGYTNKGFIIGDWIGREAKGGQAWFTYHFAPDYTVELTFLNKKTAKDFIAEGTTQNQFSLDVSKRFICRLELQARLTRELWKAPLYIAGSNGTTTGFLQLTWHPQLIGPKP